MKFYVTTSIAYVNAPPHIGFALESLQADVLARYQKLSGKDVFFLTGTDEHGIKIVRAAKTANKTPRELVNDYSLKFEQLKKSLNLSWDNFIRTSDKKTHWPIAQEIWNKIYKAGDLKKKNYKGLYCVGHESFITQKDLTDGKCADHNQEPEVIEEENWFFDISKYIKKIEGKLNNSELKIYPITRRNEILSLLKEKPKSVSFSRPSKDLSWGVPVPNDKTQTMYVWADALSNYISGYGGMEEWKKHPADVHIIGKDILRFHAIIWPAMLLSADLPLPKKIFVHGFITSMGQKISKTIGNIVDPFKIVEKYGTDALRYYLLKEISSTEDSDFTIEKFEKTYNSDLANGIGNTLSRVITMTEKYKEIFNFVYSAEATSAAKTGQFSIFNTDEKWEDIVKISGECVDYAMKNYDTPKALDGIWYILRKIDEDIDKTKPWILAKNSEKSQLLNSLLYSWLEVLRHVGILIKPFLPETADKITKQLGFNEKKKEFRVKKGDSLFPRISSHNT